MTLELKVQKIFRRWKFIENKKSEDGKKTSETNISLGKYVVHRFYNKFLFFLSFYTTYKNVSRYHEYSIQLINRISVQLIRLATYLRWHGAVLLTRVYTRPRATNYSSREIIIGERNSTPKFYTEYSEHVFHF